MNGNIKHYAGHVGRPKTKDSCNKPDSCLKNQNLNAMISYFKQNKPWSRTSAIVTLALDSKSPLESSRRAGTEFGGWLPCNCRSTSVPSPLADFDAYPFVWVDLETQVPSQVKVSVGFLCTNGTLFQTKVICCFPSEQVDSDHIKLHATVWWNTITKILGGNWHIVVGLNCGGTLLQKKLTCIQNRLGNWLSNSDVYLKLNDLKLLKCLI